MKASLTALVLALLLAPAAGAQEEHAHAHGDTDQLGTVHFPNSCKAEVAGEFTRAVALLHSFGYEESRLAFESVAQKDPACGIAQWGIAMTYYHPIWLPPSPADYAAGKAAAGRGLELGAKTERESGYIAAIAVFYSHEGRMDHAARAAAYRDAMAALSRRFPEDHEATIFYALSLLGTAPPNDHSYATQKHGFRDPERAAAGGARPSRHRALHDPRVRLSGARERGASRRRAPTRRSRRTLRTRSTCRPTSSRVWASGRSRSPRTWTRRRPADA